MFLLIIIKPSFSQPKFIPLNVKKTQTLYLIKTQLKVMPQPLRHYNLNFISFGEIKQNGAKATELFRYTIVSQLFENSVNSI
jgi:hypothetical protein